MALVILAVFLTSYLLAVSGNLNEGNFVEMEGTWKLFPENAKFEEEDLSSNISGSPVIGKNSSKSIATLTIEPTPNSTIGDYTVGIKVFNSIVVPIKIYKDFWRTNESLFMTKIGVAPQILKLENDLKDIVQNPDSAKIVSGNLVLKKGIMMATFVR